MRIRLEIDLSNVRLRAQWEDGSIPYDDEAVVATTRAPDGGELITAIGTEAKDPPLGSPRPLLSPFRGSVVAGVLASVAMSAWSQRRPRFWGFSAMLDGVDVVMHIEGYGDLAREQTREFEKSLPYRPRLHWWIEGEKIRQ